MNHQSSRFEIQNKNITDLQPAGQFSNNYKKLPKAKLFFACLCLIALIVGSKNIFTTRSAKSISGLHTSATPVVAAEQSSQNQAQPTPETIAVQTAPAATIPTSTASEKNQITITNTPTGYLNVRNQPSLDASIIGKVNPGETYSYIVTKYGWYNIKLNNKQSGWIDGVYATVVE